MTPPTRAAKLSAEGQRIVDAINKRIEELQNEFTKAITEKNSEISELKNEVYNLKNEVTKLESRLNDSDSQLRSNNIVLTGNELPVEPANENCIETVRELFRIKLRTIVPSTDILSAKRLGKPNVDSASTNRRPILIKCKNESLKENRSAP